MIEIVKIKHKEDNKFYVEFADENMIGFTTVIVEDGDLCSITDSVAHNGEHVQEEYKTTFETEWENNKPYVLEVVKDKVLKMELWK